MKIVLKKLGYSNVLELIKIESFCKRFKFFIIMLVQKVIIHIFFADIRVDSLELSHSLVIFSTCSCVMGTGLEMSALERSLTHLFPMYLSLPPENRKHFGTSMFCFPGVEKRPS